MRRRDLWNEHFANGKHVFEEWDRNEDIDEIFAEADLETDGETLCEAQITMTARQGNISSVLIRIFDPKTDEILVEHEDGNVSYELGRPELLDLLTSIKETIPFRGQTVCLVGTLCLSRNGIVFHKTGDRSMLSRIGIALQLLDPPG